MLKEKVLKSINMVLLVHRLRVWRLMVGVHLLLEVVLPAAELERN
jgi:hypothetical protein